MILAYNKYRASLYFCEKEDADGIEVGDPKAKARAFFVGLLADEHGEAIDPKVVHKLISMSRMAENLRNEVRDRCEDDRRIRSLARRVLTEQEVAGDDLGIPDIGDLVEKIVKKLEEKK